MPGNGQTMYKKARKESGFTLERATQALNVSETTLKEWERGTRRPDNAAVSRMAEAYHTPWLRAERALETFDELGIIRVGNAPEILQGAVLDHYSMMLDLMDGYRRFIQITADGVIDDSELEDYDIIQQVLLRNSVASLRLACIREDADTKKERPDAPTSKRSVQGLRREPNQGKYTTHAAYCASPNFAGTGGELL